MPAAFTGGFFFMRARSIRCLLAGAGAVLAIPALACSCHAPEKAGFIHADVVHLPSNARGALFLPALDTLSYLDAPLPGIVLYRGKMTPLRPSAFSITVDGAAARLPVALTALDTPLSTARRAERAFLIVGAADPRWLRRRIAASGVAPLIKSGKLREITREHQAALRFVRVGPQGGFRPGHRYTIRYLTPVAARWSYPREVEHVIDAQPVTTGAAGYALVAEGAPLRRMLPQMSLSGSCSSRQPAITQFFHYAIPVTHERYRAAMLYLSESRAEIRPASVPPGEPWPPQYVSSLCDAPPAGLTPMFEGRDLIHTRCSAGAGRASVSGWAGLLEVEDRAWPAGVLQVDFGQAQGTSCGAYAMLSEALAAGDKRRIAIAACGVEGEEWDAEPDVRQAPAVTALLPFMSASEPQLARCTHLAAARVLADVPGQAALAFDVLAKSNLAALRSGGEDRIQATLDWLKRATDGVFWREHTDAASLLRNERLLRPLIPALTERARAGSRDAEELIAVVTPKAAVSRPD